MGWKARFLEDQILFNGAGFFYNYQNLQVFQVRNVEGNIPTNELLNAEDVRVVGLEADLTMNDLLLPFVPLQGFRSFLSFAYLYTEYTDFTNVISIIRPSPEGVVVTNELQNFSGNQLISAPEVSFAGYASYDIPLGDLGMIVPRLDFSYRSEVFFSPKNDSRVGDDALWLLHGRISFRDPNRRFELSLWMRNILDEEYRVEAIDQGELQDRIIYVMGDPRTYGITLGVSF